MSKFTNPSANFRGRLAGLTITDFYGIDYRKETKDERLKEVNDKLDILKPFIDEYFFFKETDENDNGEFEDMETEQKKYFKYNPNLTEELSEDINICKALEIYGTYLLRSKDMPRERQQEYKILTEERFKKILQKEKTLSELNKNYEGDLEGYTIDQLILDTRPSNDYNNLTLNIKKKDLNINTYINNRAFKEYFVNVNPSVNKKELDERNMWLIDILEDYIRLHSYLKIEMAAIKDGEKSKFNLMEIIRLMSSTKRDMLDSKEQLRGIRSQAKKLGDESPFNDFSKIDYKNPNHIRLCLKYCAITRVPRPDDMVSHIGYDLYVALKELKKNKKIDKLDSEILNCYNSGRYTIRDIAKEIERQPNVIIQRLNKISKRISEII